jgi:hypothetical protein
MMGWERNRREHKVALGADERRHACINAFKLEWK